jgi:site-specific recombinase XerD
MEHRQGNAPQVAKPCGNSVGDARDLNAMTAEAKPPGLIQRYREELQVRHDARRTVKTYQQWLRRFLHFHAMRHPRTMGSAEVNAFLSHLAVDLQVSPSTQNQVLAALLTCQAWLHQLRRFQ